MYKNKGITLIALVITIIILLILAGVAILQLTENGFFEKAKLAKEKQDNAQKLENITLADYENKIGEYVQGNSREEGITSDSTSGVYIGTGNLGIDHKNTLVFDKKPNIVIIYSVGIAEGYITSNVFVQGCEYSNIGTYSGENYQGVMQPNVVEWQENGKKLVWYSEINAINQMNSLNSQYKYVAIY